jgi:hypothetical protein
MSPQGSNSIRHSFSGDLQSPVVHRGISAPIPKHNCAIVDELLGFHYAHAMEDETRGDCR